MFLSSSWTAKLSALVLLFFFVFPNAEFATRKFIYCSVIYSATVILIRSFFLFGIGNNVF